VTRRTILVQQNFYGFIRLILKVVDGGSLMPKVKEGKWSHRETKRAENGW